jgi:hypothetical protein
MVDRQIFETAKAPTLALIQRYAPRESAIAEPMWDDLSANAGSVEFARGDPFLGLGLELLGTALFAKIVIPVVVAALSETAKRTVDIIFDALNARFKAGRRELSDSTIRKIAEEIRDIAIGAKTE